MDDSHLLNSLSSSHIPVNVFSITNTTALGDHKRFRHVYELNETLVAEKIYSASSVTIYVCSDKTLQKNLKELRESLWWNHEAYFVLVDTDFNDSCSKARAFLNVEWIFNLLFVVYICRNSNDQLMFYAFNPYTGSGPKFWNILQSDNLTDETWSLLEYRIEPSFKFYG